MKKSKEQLDEEYKEFAKDMSEAIEQVGKKDENGIYVTIPGICGQEDFRLYSTVQYTEWITNKDEQK